MPYRWASEAGAAFALTDNARGAVERFQPEAATLG
jgi:hypothetical protein